ncbi:MAG: DMT family transporter [Candidatus Aenigmatarchaeota archaeon]
MDYGILSAIISPVLSSMATIFKSGATKALSPIAAASIGSIIGGTLIIILLILRKKRPTLAKISENRSDFLKLLFLRSTVGELFFVFGLSMTTAIKSIFLTKVEPYFVLFFSWFVKKEKIKPVHVILLTANILGALLLSTSGNFSMFGASQIGDILIVIAMGFFAGSYFYAKRLSKKVGAMTTNGIAQFVGGLVLLPLMLIITPQAQLISETGWTYLVAYVLLFNVIGLTLWYFSLKTVRPWIVSSLRAIGPLAGAPLAFLLFGEMLTTIQLVGAIIILASSSAIVYEHSKKPV